MPWWTWVALGIFIASLVAAGVIALVALRTMVALQSVGERLATALEELAAKSDDLERRALNQAARELMLAQSSDWAFIMKTGTMVEYAVERTKIHVLNFNQLYEEIKKNEIDEPWLCQIEARHNIFPDLDYRIYQ